MDEVVLQRLDVFAHSVRLVTEIGHTLFGLVLQLKLRVCFFFPPVFEAVAMCGDVTTKKNSSSSCLVLDEFVCARLP